MDSVKSFSALSSSALFTWGANSHGQLGHAYAEDVYEPRVARCELPAGGLRALCGGGGHSALITEAGQLLVCGQNHRGQLGLGHTSEVTTFRLCFSLGQRSVRQVSCGWDFTLILTDGGQVLACGSNTYGQLGLPQVPGHTAEPLPLQALKEHVLCVAAGLRHALAVTCLGGVYQWGKGLSSQAKRALSPQAIPEHLTSKEPCLVPGLDDVTPQRVVAGAAHCVCLTTGGDVFLWGSNKQGQLGTTRSFVAWPALLDRTLMGGESVTDVWSGWAHLVAKTESGRVFSWGRSDYGQLGRAVSASQSLRVPSGDSVTVDSGLVACIPVQVEALAGAAQIACGSEHNLAIVGDRLLSWGWNEHGMCGDGSCADVPHPTPIAVLQDARPVLIGCGAGHSMALCTTTVFGPTRTAEGASGGRGDMVGTTPLPSRLTPPTSGTSCSTAQDTG
ncbi:secretion-regulating guanine nucleotide exchange factor isoform X1 [Scleropages formosus]|uniref:Secretion regulating guanine nucleotide exchange factor n=1 Tax=Scleropages formosus TaxID=113540 RepID=A0A8C9SN97_SCLFO|nr:secretion-regulating guanine nucleotide exchange factor isoform X1 [Scleropages formosus]